MAYGITVLVKLAISATTSTSRIGRFVDLKGLQVARYPEELVSHLSTAVGANQHRVATIFLAIIKRLNSWYGKEDRVELCYVINEERRSQGRDSPSNGTKSHIIEMATFRPQCLLRRLCSRGVRIHSQLQYDLRRPNGPSSGVLRAKRVGYDGTITRNIDGNK